MPLADDILKPIAGANPSGVYLRYDPVYSQIEDARREDDDVSQGVWLIERKLADWPRVQKLAGEALTRKSKDLQLAAWLTEALVHREGFAGFRQGAAIMLALLDTFWDTIYPELEDGDAEMRSVPLQFLGAPRMDAALRSIALTAAGIGYKQYKDSTQVPTEEEAGSNDKKRQARTASIDDGKTTPEEVDTALKQTPPEFFTALGAELRQCREVIDSLDERCNERFGEFAPSLSSLKECFEQLANAARILAQRRAAALSGQRQEPKPTAAPAQSTASDWDRPAPASNGGHDWDSPAAASGGHGWDSPAPAEAAHGWDAPAEPSGNHGWDAPAPNNWDTSEPPASTAPEPVAVPATSAPAWSEEPIERASSGSLEPFDSDDAVARLAAAARFLRLENPADPGAYLLTRAWRWGELRPGAPEPAWYLLEAPPSETRQLLKRLAQEQQWLELLDASEQAQAEPCGRAWLDLQRYSLTALRSLGADYRPVETAIRTELALFLAALPKLPERLLTDDTPAATRETIDFFRKEGLSGASAPHREPAPAPLPVPSEDDQVNEFVRLRRYDQALALLSRQLAQESTGRGRFQRKARLAQILMASGRRSVAYPILRDLSGEIMERRLDQWEPPELVVEPLVQLHHCLKQMDESPSEQQKLYELICRLDPLRAVELS